MRQWLDMGRRWREVRQKVFTSEDGEYVWETTRHYSRTSNEISQHYIEQYRNQEQKKQDRQRRKAARRELFSNLSASIQANILTPLKQIFFPKENEKPTFTEPTASQIDQEAAKWLEGILEDATAPKAANGEGLNLENTTGTGVSPGIVGPQSPQREFGRLTPDESTS